MRGRYWRLECFAIAAAIALWGASRVHAMPDQVTRLSEEQVVRHALARPGLAEAWQGSVARAEGMRATVSAHANPQLAYTREQTYGPNGTGEDYLSIAQSLDLGNKRGLRGGAADKRVELARAETENWGVQVAFRARTRFYEVLRRRARVQALEAWLTQLAEVLEVVSRRERSGEAAAYEHRRIERELSASTGRLEEERVYLQRAQNEVAALIDLAPESFSLQGSLLPSESPREAAEVTSTNNPSLRVLALQAQAGRLEAEAASRAWIPDVRLEGGFKGVNLGQQTRSDGFLVGVSLSLPVLDRAAGALQAAEAEVRQASGLHDLRRAEVNTELKGARTERERLRQLALAFEQRTQKISADLVRITTAGYLGGELGLLELLDAYRGVTDDQLTLLELESAARAADLEVARLTGKAAP